MKKILLLFLLISGHTYAQNKYGKLTDEQGDSIMASAVTDYDKFQKVSTTHLKYALNLEPDNKTKTLNISFNLSRSIDAEKNDTIHMITIKAINRNSSFCGTGDKISILLNNENSHSFNSAGGKFNPTDRTWEYTLWCSVPTDFVKAVYSAEQIDLQCYLNELNLGGKFSNDNLKILKMYLQQSILN